MVLPLPQHPPTQAQDSPTLPGERHPKKRKDREHKKDKEHRSSSRCSPTRLRPSTTLGDHAVAMDFLKYDLMISNRINVQLDNYEIGPYSATTSALDFILPSSNSLPCSTRRSNNGR